MYWGEREEIVRGTLCSGGRGSRGEICTGGEGGGGALCTEERRRCSVLKGGCFLISVLGVEEKLCSAISSSDATHVGILFLPVTPRLMDTFFFR